MFAHDFSHVRIHTDGLAQQSARAVGAQAYTVANRVVFGQGAYAPDTGRGRKLIAHELTHVIQQGSGLLPSRSDPLRIDDSGEAAAQRAPDRAVIGRRSHSADPERQHPEEMMPHRAVPGAILMPVGRTRADGRGRQLQRSPDAGVLPWLAGAAAKGTEVVGRGLLAGASGIAAAGSAAASFFWAKDADLKPDEERRLLEQDRENALLRIGDQIRSHTQNLIIHLARILGSDVAGMPPDHQRDPERDKPHWWEEILNLIKEITKHGLSPKQLGRELSKKFTKEQVDAIIAALRKAAELLGKDPPDFPPVAFP